MNLKTFAFLAIAAMTTSFAHASADLVITRIMINPNGSNDDNRGLEGWTITNVGDASIDLGANHVALVAIENEHGQNGELDWWYELSGTLASHASIVIRDLDNNSALQTVTTANGTNMTSVSTTSLEFFSGNGGTDMSNSGDNFILVGGFDHTKINPKTGVAYAFLDTLDNGTGVGGLFNQGEDLKFDFKQTTGTTSDDLWTSEYDAVAVAPDAGEAPSGFDNYTTFLTGLPHKVVGVINSDGWTADCLMRLKDSVTGAWDEMLQFDVLAPASNIIKNDIGDTPVQLNLMSQDSYTLTGTGSVPGTVRFEFSFAQRDNLTDWTGFTGLTINGDLYTFADH